jgi:hypothetical protein
MHSVRFRIVATALSAVLLQGCFATTVTASGRAGSQHHEPGASLFWGIGTPRHGATQCEHGLKEVTIYRPWYSHFVAVITLGIVTPISADWTCIEGGAAAPAAAPTQP